MSATVRRLPLREGPSAETRPTDVLAEAQRILDEEMPDASVIVMLAREFDPKDGRGPCADWRWVRGGEAFRTHLASIAWLDVLKSELTAELVRQCEYATGD